MGRRIREKVSCFPAKMQKCIFCGEEFSFSPWIPEDPLVEARTYHTFQSLLSPRRVPDLWWRLYPPQEGVILLSPFQEERGICKKCLISGEYKKLPEKEIVSYIEKEINFLI